MKQDQQSYFAWDHWLDDMT